MDASAQMRCARLAPRYTLGDMLDVEITRELSDVDKASLWGWGTDIFRTESLGLKWRPKEWHLIAREGQRAISKVSLLKHTVTVGELHISVGGVGGVVTVPEAQRRGLASALMARAALFVRDDLGCNFGFLFCLDDKVGFYKALGWQLVTVPVVVLQPHGEIVMSLNAMTLQLGPARWPDAPVNLLSEPW